MDDIISKIKRIYKNKLNLFSERHIFIGLSDGSKCNF